MKQQALRGSNLAFPYVHAASFDIFKDNTHKEWVQYMAICPGADLFRFLASKAEVVPAHN